MKTKISSHMQLKFFKVLYSELKGFKVSLKINSRKKNTKLAGNIEAIGFFDIDLEKEKPNILFNNGLSIIYGLLRGIVFEKPTILNIHEKLLPTVDLTEVIKKKINTQLEN